MENFVKANKARVEDQSQTITKLATYLEAME